MHCVSVCMSKTESKSEVQIGFFVGPFEARHDPTCIKECVRAKDHVSIFKVTNTVSRTLHSCGTGQNFNLLVSLAWPLRSLGCLSGNWGGHCSLTAMCGKDPGLARGSRRFRIDFWPLTPVLAIITPDVQLRLARIAS